MNSGRRCGRRAYHGAERNLAPQLLSDAKREGSLAGARRARHEQRSPGHLLLLYHVDHDPAGLARLPQVSLRLVNVYNAHRLS